MDDQLEIKKEAHQHCRESLYRMRWLMAHNRLHEIVHKGELVESEKPSKQWNEYLADLNAADEVASKPA